MAARPCVSGLVQFNCPDGSFEARQRHRLADTGRVPAKLKPVQHWFPSDKLEDRLARVPAARSAINMSS